MVDVSKAEGQIQCVKSFEDLLLSPFQGIVNALCLARDLEGDFAEIVNKFELEGNIMELDEEDLQALELSPNGQLAREIILADMKQLREANASPILNIIAQYDRDEEHPFFPTDVYSFHVDRSPIPSFTYLCTYYGAASEILANSKAEQKIQIPEIRSALQKLYGNAEAGFEDFLKDNFFDLHYQAKPNAPVTNLGLGNIWKLAIDHPESPVLPCVHRAPKEKSGEKRLLLIC